MFEFEKQIMKADNKYPMVGYAYKVIPTTERGKFAFAKWKRDPQRMLRNSEIKSFITENLDINKEPFVGIVKLYEDVKEHEAKTLVDEVVLRKLAVANVPGVDYNDQFGSFKRHLNPLEYRKDFVIEIVKKITYEQPKSLSFDDIKAL